MNFVNRVSPEDFPYLSREKKYANKQTELYLCMEQLSNGKACSNQFWKDLFYMTSPVKVIINLYAKKYDTLFFIRSSAYSIANG